MVIRYNDILSLITTLGDTEGIKVTVKESAKGGLIAGTACALGGVVLGPPGLALGGAVGGCVAAYLSSNNFKPISQVITNDMAADKQELLVNAVRNILGDADATDAMELIALVQGNTMLKARIAQEMVTFFSNNMGMQAQMQS